MHASGNPDDGTRPAGAGRTFASPTLARVAAALEIPEAAFSAWDPPGEVEARERAALLDLVRIHLRGAGPEGRGRFAAALRALLDAEAR